MSSLVLQDSEKEALAVVRKLMGRSKPRWTCRPGDEVEVVYSASKGNVAKLRKMKCLGKPPARGFYTGSQTWYETPHAWFCHVIPYLVSRGGNIVAVLRVKKGGR